MNKKILTMLAVLTVCAGVMAGCSKGTKQENTETFESIMQSEVIEGEHISAENDKNIADEDVSEVIGKVDEIKDFMFIVTDDNKVSYAFSFEEKPQGLDKIAVGDMVIVTYTGTISEVDPFMGEILSVEKK